MTRTITILYRRVTCTYNPGAILLGLAFMLFALALTAPPSFKFGAQEANIACVISDCHPLSLLFGVLAVALDTIVSVVFGMLAAAMTDWFLVVTADDDDRYRPYYERCMKLSDYLSYWMTLFVVYMTAIKVIAEYKWVFTAIADWLG